MLPNNDKHLLHSEDQCDDTYFPDCNQDHDIHPNQLSGDENATQSVLVISTVGDQSKANFGLTVTTIIKTVIGSGILSMPFTVSKMGWIFGSIVFLIAGLLTQFGSLLLLKAKNLSHHSNYSTILYQIWRNKLAKGIGSIIIFLNNIGVCNIDSIKGIAELIIFKESINKILGDVLGADSEIMSQFYTQPYFIVLVMALLETPLTLVKKMEKLKFMALSGVTGIVIFMISFAIFYVKAVADQNPLNNPVGGMKAFPTEWFKAAAAVPNVLLALSYQMNFFPIFKGMRGVSDSRMLKAVLVGVIFCTLSYLMIGIMGYDYVGQNPSANFLYSLNYQKIPAPFFFIINFGFLISIFFAFPIMFFGCRNNFIALIQLVLLKNKQAKLDKGWRRGDQIEHISQYIQEDEVEVKKKKANLHFIVYTLGIYLVIIGVTMGVDNIEAVFNIIGAICSSSIGVLLPCFFYFMLINQKKKPRTIKYYLSLGLFAVMAPYALFSIIALYVNP